MSKVLAIVYGIVCYFCFFFVFLYLIGFVLGVTPKTVDTGPTAPFGVAVAIDVGLIALFAVSHSVMARPKFKQSWTKIVPRPVERSTYVLVASGALALLMWQWRPITGMMWSIETPSLRYLVYAIALAGWTLAFIATFAINHFNLFGLHQVYNYARGVQPGKPEFRQPILYRLVRHPLMLGLIVAFWAAPDMTLGHLLFAAGLTGYILIVLPIEERDLVGIFGDRYRKYRNDVPMLIPIPKRRRGDAAVSDNASSD